MHEKSIRKVIAGSLLIVCASFGFTQTANRLMVQALPYGSLPLGSSAGIFTLGAGIEASATYQPSFTGNFGLKAGTAYLNLPLAATGSESAVWSISGFAGPVFRLPLGDRLSLFAEGLAGYYQWDASGWDAGENAGGGFVAAASAGALFRIAGAFTMGAGVSYDYYDKLYNGLRLQLSVTLDLPGLAGERSSIEIREIRLMPLFPVLYSYYTRQPIGTAVVVNTGKKPIEDISVQFFTERYMDNPMTVGEKISLQPGEEKTVELYALFNDRPMEITEGVQASARVSSSYQGSKTIFTSENSGILEFRNRNALTWDDDRKIVSFITAKDPEIMNFAKNVSSWLQGVKNSAIDENLQKAMAIFEAVKAYGIHYEIDPTTPFSEFSENQAVIDFLQFPRQTLQFTNGDCDDLSALYTALLEAIGVETAFITVPGHIYAAVALKSNPTEARRNFRDSAELIITEDKAWLPVEITLFQDSFEKAWQAGAKQWREHSVSDAARLYPVHEAWGVYQPVALSGSDSRISLPDRQNVSDALQATLSRHIEKEIYPQVQALQQQLARNQGSAADRNRLALVYARYGQYDQAMEQLQLILARQNYLPAAINAANIHYLRGQTSEALARYQQALELAPENTTALLGLARCNYDMENYGSVRQAYATIKTLNPQLAERYAYLEMRDESAARASAIAELKNTVAWEESE
ncbi:MAG: tetratricopeptide repeat protein [Spirochaetes bacterium]|nr:tetratricopeptide repeat protein [Spirochaetota bacterium]